MKRKTTTRRDNDSEGTYNSEMVGKGMTFNYVLFTITHITSQQSMTIIN